MKSATNTGEFQSASSNKSQVRPVDPGEDQNGELYMDAARARRFRDALDDLDQANAALLASTSLFPLILPAKGEVNAATTVEAFASLMKARLAVMFSMLENEEHLDFPAGQ